MLSTIAKRFVSPFKGYNSQPVVVAACFRQLMTHHGQVRVLQQNARPALLDSALQEVRISFAFGHGFDHSDRCNRKRCD
jgi:hypothetical protein